MAGSEYYQANRDAVLARAHEYYWTHREERLAYQRKRYAEKRDQIISAVHDYRERNADTIREKDRARYRANPERYASYVHTRRAKTNGRRGDTVLRTTVFERDGWTCHICGHAVDRSAVWPDANAAVLDHITPLAEGGGHTADNTACAHHCCNGWKGSSPLTPELRTRLSKRYKSMFTRPLSRSCE